MNTFYVLNLRRSFILTLLILLNLQLFSASYRNYVTHQVVNSGSTLRVWIDSDTAFGETALAQIRWGEPGSYSYSGFQLGNYDNTTTPGANWYVDISLAGVPNDAELELATRNEFDVDYGYTGFTTMLTALPVKFSFADCFLQKDGIKILYTTATETNNEYFEIQRSTDSKNWKKITTLTGAGTTNKVQDYQAFDGAPEGGVNYYRIKQVDYDGSYSYSSIVSAFWKPITDIQLGSVPVKEQLNIIGLSALDTQVLLSIYNTAGQRVKEEQYQGTAIDLKALPNGIYFLQISASGSLIATKQFIVQH